MIYGEICNVKEQIEKILVKFTETCAPRVIPPYSYILRTDGTDVGVGVVCFIFQFSSSGSPLSYPPRSLGVLEDVEARLGAMVCSEILRDESMDSQQCCAIDRGAPTYLPLASFIGLRLD